MVKQPRHNGATTKACHCTCVPRRVPPHACPGNGARPRGVRNSICGRGERAFRVGGLQRGEEGEERGAVVRRQGAEGVA